jgi:agmatinase
MPEHGGARLKPKESAIGYGGSEVIDLESLPEKGRGGVCFFGVDIDIARRFGPSNNGAAVFLRSASARLYPWTHATATVRNRISFDIGVFGKHTQNIGEQITELGYLLSTHDYVPALLGCDHTSSYLHVLGVSKNRPLTYFYLDAHLDLGLHIPGGLDNLHNGNFVSFLMKNSGIKEVVNIGARAWSTFNEVYDKIDGLTVIREQSFEKIVPTLERFTGQEIYVSIDADVLDPLLIPGVCCPEPFGMTPDALLNLCSWLSQNCTIRGADFVEMRAPESAASTAEIALRCLHELLQR